MTPVATTLVANNGLTVDSTPLLSGTFTSNLNAGEVIKVYDGATLLGTATVDAQTKTWTYQLSTAAALGSHSYVAKVESGAGAVISSSTAYVINRIAPVVLDMNGDGVMSYNQLQMDMNGDGVLDNTAWVAPQDGVLVRDSFGDGSVRSTSQFAFARHSGETDLQGLAAQFDSNHDGVFDRHDAKFGEFAVWQDADADGMADAGEVKSLTDLGIVSINLVSDGVHRTPATGVTEFGQTTATLTNGTTLSIADAAFEYHAKTDAVSVIPAEASVIPASEPGSMTPVSLVLQASETIFDLTSFIAHNGNTNVTQIDLTGTGNNTVRLSLNDVLQTAETPLLIKGNDGDVVELFTQGQAPIQSTAGSYTSYDFDANGYVDLLVDQQVRVTMM
jgi:hypothetical protein